MNLEDLYRLLRTTHLQAQSIVDTVREPLLVLDRELCVVAASRSFFETFKVGRDETVGQPLYELGERQWDIPDLRRLLEEVMPRSRAVEGYEVEHGQGRSRGRSPFSALIALGRSFGRHHLTLGRRVSPSSRDRPASGVLAPFRQPDQYAQR